MRHVSDQRGFSLVEMLVSLLVALIVFGAAMSALDLFQRDNRWDQLRNEAQDNARSAVDRLGLYLRNTASPSAGSAGALEAAGPYDLTFQTVSSSQTFGGSNTTNQMRTRYCLNTSNSSNEILEQQIQTWTSSTAPAIPSESQCPSKDANWTKTYAVVSNITNEINGQNRQLFNYNPCGTSCSSTSSIKGVEVDLFLNPDTNNTHPGETELKSGIYFRNSLSPPVANFTDAFVSGQEVLNASSSTDPNGQSLTYQWSKDGTAISGATAQTYTDSGPFTSGTSHTYMLTVTNTGGLSNSYSKTISF
jgi:prepilin-type N-terminal cleavage/methylation domain-containing protein